MGRSRIHSVSLLAQYRSRNLACLRLRGWGWLVLFLLVMLAGEAGAQSVPIPNPNWPMDSVVNSSVHKYTVHGDPNYAEPSWFVWNVKGGTLYLDAAATIPASSAHTDTVRGIVGNITSLYVQWELFNGALDTGYVYVYEISAKGCQRPDTDEGKYQGMRIKVSAPPDVRFLTDVTTVCAYDVSFSVEIGIDGMPPFDLEYSINDTIYYMHVDQEDLIDSDGDGNVDNVLITRNDFTGTTQDLIYQFELLNASSGGVAGNIGKFASHSVIVFAQPAAPFIRRELQDVTANVANNYQLQDPGEQAKEWYWELIDDSNHLYFGDTTALPTVNVLFDVAPGNYYLVAYFLSENGCYSLADTMAIRVYDYPTIAFLDPEQITGCSMSSMVSGEYFDFTVHYEGAPSYSFTCTVYDYNGNIVGIYPYSDNLNRDITVSIFNDFINDVLPPEDQTWKVVITNATNEEGIGVTILDAEISGGRDERSIIIHPKPIITDDINFAN